MIIKTFESQRPQKTELRHDLESIRALTMELQIKVEVREILIQKIRHELGFSNEEFLVFYIEVFGL